MMPETPCSSANTASSAVKMPLTSTGNAVMERSQSTVSQVTRTPSWPSSSIPTKLASTSGGGGIGTACRLLCSPHHRGCGFERMIDVELEPERTRSCLGNLFQRTCRIGTGNHQGASSPRAQGGRALPFRMSQAMKGCGSNQNRHPYRQTQHTGAGIALGDIDHHTRAQADAREISLIGPQGDLVITAACIIIPVDRVHPFLRQNFIVKNVERFHTCFLPSSSVFNASPIQEV